MRDIGRNLLVAFGYNLAGAPVAASVLDLAFEGRSRWPSTAAAMALSGGSGAPSALAVGLWGDDGLLACELDGDQGAACWRQ